MKHENWQIHVDHTVKFDSHRKTITDEADVSTLHSKLKVLLTLKL